ncbi:MAG: ribosome biogenesis GTPase Der [Acidobacteria bacterium]|nr:MAG: ribosome biogenesis GTPase Der [Acidobacteriota bacterium]
MAPSSKLPLIAIVGRPNVGKSTLFNRITGKRRALVSREPGMTRDRRIEPAEWCGRYFFVVDTGGLQDEDNPLGQLISEQALKAIQEGDLIFFTVDGREGITPQDQEIATLLRRLNKDVILLVNKIDSPQKEGSGAEFHELGFPTVIEISADHGLNVDIALDRLVDLLNPPQSLETKDPEAAIVILGKPNAGKSTFLNQLLGQERLVTSDIPGTTRDTVDLEVYSEGHLYKFIDTAGIRKKGQTKTVPDKLAVIHARKSLERAHIACLMIDGSEGVTHQDAVIGGYAREEGKAVVLILNKMDLLNPAQRKTLEMDVESKLQFIGFAPRLYISAKTGQNVKKVFPLLQEVYDSFTKRVTTGQLNAFFDKALADRYLGSYRGKPIKLKYITQTGVKPPTFILFTNAGSQLHFSHYRYLENQLRSHFGFRGTTIRIKVRATKKR